MPLALAPAEERVAIFEKMANGLGAENTSDVLRMPVVGLEDFGHGDDPPRHVEAKKSSNGGEGGPIMGFRGQRTDSFERTHQLHGEDCESNSVQFADERSAVDAVSGTTHGRCHQAPNPEHSCNRRDRCDHLQGRQDGREEGPIHADGEATFTSGNDLVAHCGAGSSGWTQRWEDLFRELGGNVQEAAGQGRCTSTPKDGAYQTRTHGSDAGGAVACVAPLVCGDVKPLPPQRDVQHENWADNGGQTGRSNGDATALLGQALRGHQAHGMIQLNRSGQARDPSWPLHVKEVGRIERKRAEQYIHPKYWAMWCEAWAIIEMSTPELLVEALLVTTAKYDRAEAAVTREDIQILLVSGNIEVTRFEDVLGTVKAFVTPEAPKKRYRLITAPHINDLEGSKPAEPMLDLCGMKELLDTEDEGGIQDDFPWFYGQFEMSSSARAWYCFTFEGQWYRLVTVPTGGRAEPNMAHALTASLVRLAAEEENGQELPPAVKGKAFIDNACFTGSQERATSAMRTFRKLSVDAGVTISRETPQWDQRYVFLGIAIDHHEKTVSLSEKTGKKLQLVAEELECWPHDVTLRQLLAFLGLWVWCASILGSIKASWYVLLKFIRRRVNAKPLEERVGWWRLALESAKAVTSTLLTNTPRQCSIPGTANHGVH